MFYLNGRTENKVSDREVERDRSASDSKIESSGSPKLTARANARSKNAFRIRSSNNVSTVSEVALQFVHLLNSNY